MKTTYLNTIIFILLPIICFSQEDSKDDNYTILDRITIRQAFDSKFTKGEPASVNLVFPQDTTEDSYNLNLAVGINLLSEISLLNLSPVYEIKKNTLIAKEQDVRKYGITTDWDLYDVFANKWTPNVFGKLNWKDDRIKESKSFEAKLYLTAYFLGSAGKISKFYIPERITDLKIAHFSYNPYIGFEYENKVESNSEVEEAMTRLYLRLKANLLLLPKYFDDKLKFTYDYTFRQDTKDSDNFDSRSHPLTKLSLSYKLSKIRNTGEASIGIDYTNGDNPSNGFEKQEFYSVVFKFKY